MLEAGDKVLIAHRRLFEKDQPRCFVGSVLAYDAGLVKVHGYSFARNLMSGALLRKDDTRTRILSILSGSFLVYQLPKETKLDQVHFEMRGTESFLTDGGSLTMNMSERPNPAHL